MPLSPDDRALALALRGSIAAEAVALGGLYAAKTKALGRDTAAIAADAALLGAGNALSYLRQVELARPPRRDGARMGLAAYAARLPFGDRVARPGVRAWLLADEALTEAPVEAGDALVYADVSAPSVVLNAAVQALFGARGKVTVLVEEAWVAPIGRALGRAGARVHVEAGGAPRAAELARQAAVVTAIAKGADRAAIAEGATREETKPALRGYDTDAPATYVVFPHYYDKAELRQIARSVAADLRASPAALDDVDVVVCRTWEQRALFAEILGGELAPKGDARTPIPERRVGRDGSAEARPAGLGLTVLDTDAPGDLPIRASAWLASAAGRTHAVAAWVHVLELEKPGRARAVDELLLASGAGCIALNARPSLAYLLGAVPFGPSGQGVQNAPRTAGATRVLVEAPFHMAPCEARGWALARDRYEHAPSLPRAVGLALRAIF